MRTATSWMAQAAAKASLGFALLALLLPLRLTGQANPLQRRVTLSLDATRLDDALFALGAAGDFDFSYNASIIPQDSIVSLHVTEAPVRKVLTELIGPGYLAKPIGNHIVISRRAAPPQSPAPGAPITLRGYLINAETGDKVPLATVFAGPKAVATTDSSGHYVLTLPGGQADHPISFSKMGYHDTVVVAHPMRNTSLTVGIRPVAGFGAPMTGKEVSLIGDRAPEPLPLIDWFVGQEQQALAANLEAPIRTFPFQVSLLPALGTNRILSGGMENHFSLNILAGYSSGLRGVELGGLTNINRENVRGLQVAGLANVVGGDVRGVQVAGLINHVQGKVRGVQVAGVVNFSPQSVEGVQVSGMLGYAHGDVTHVQVAGLLGYARGQVRGAQVTGLLGYARGGVDGVQVSGIAAHAGESVRGGQVAGVFCEAEGDVEGAQVAGIHARAHGRVGRVQASAILNKARDVAGLQLGLVNVADTLSGFQVGLVGVVRKGYRVVELSASETFQVQAAYVNGRRGFHQAHMVGYRVGPRTQALAYGIGWGAAMRSGPMSLGAGLACMHVAESHFGFGQLNLLLPARVQAGVNIGRVEVFGGPSATLHISGAQDDRGNFRSQIAAHSFWRREGRNTMAQAWIGWQGGIRVGLWPAGQKF